MGFAMRRLVGCDGAAVIAEIAAAIEARIGVGDLAPTTFARNADAIAVPRHGRHVADDEDRHIALGTLTQKGEDRIHAIVADQPAEAFRYRIPSMQSRLACV